MSSKSSDIHALLFDPTSDDNLTFEKMNRYVVFHVLCINTMSPSVPQWRTMDSSLQNGITQEYSTNHHFHLYPGSNDSPYACGHWPTSLRTAEGKVMSSGAQAAFHQSDTFCVENEGFRGIDGMTCSWQIEAQ